MQPITLRPQPEAVKSKKLFTSYLPQIIFTIVVTYEMISYLDLFKKNNIASLAIFGISSFIAIVLVPIFIKNKKRVVGITTFFSFAAWTSFMLLFVPYNSPFLLMNYILVFYTIVTNGSKYLGYAVGLLVLGTQLVIIRDIDKIDSLVNLIGPTINIIGLIGFAITSSTTLGSDLEEEHKLVKGAKKTTVEAQRLKSLINSMADGVIGTDKNGRVILYNAASLDILNINISLEGEKLSDHLNLLDSNGKQVNIFEKAKAAKTYYITRDIELLISKNETIKLYVSIAPVRLGFGSSEQKGFIMVLRDITAEKSLEEERDEFVSVASHELRTPVTIAEGNISNLQLMAKKGVEKKDLEDNLKAAHDQIVFLADMINDLAMLSRAERGKVDTKPESIEIKEAVETILDEFKMQAEKKGLELKTQISDDVRTVFTNRLYIKEILQNFISNSVKYTKEGSVTVIAEPAKNGVTLTVKDTGIGLSKADQKRLFEKFWRSEDARTRESSGTGLGLYVTQKLAGLINAKITVKSELNVGSEFSLQVPNLDK